MSMCSKKKDQQNLNENYKNVLQNVCGVVLYLFIIYFPGRPLSQEAVLTYLSYISSMFIATVGYLFLRVC